MKVKECIVTEEEFYAIKNLSNFNWSLPLSREGVIDQLKLELEVIKFCLTLIDLKDDINGKTIDRILVIPLRKLLCEKNSILIKLEPSFKISPLTGNTFASDIGLKVVKPSVSVLPKENWITIEEFINRDIAWFVRTENYPPNEFYSEVFEAIKNRLKNGNKKDFADCFDKITIDISDVEEHIYIRKETVTKKQIEKYLGLSGYNTLTVYDFIKHHSDKLGAHIDIETSPYIKLVNQRNINSYGHFFAISFILIDAIIEQIPELSNYLEGFERLKVKKINLSYKCQVRGAVL